MNILMVEGLDITDRMGQTEYTSPSYIGLQEDALLKVSYNKHFEIIESLQQEITQYLEELRRNVPVA